MPNSHSGCYDTLLELGYVGLALLLAFLGTTLHGIGRLADRDPARAQLVLSLVLFIIIYNLLESLWLRAFDLLWVVFLILVTEIGRYWQRLEPYAPELSGGGPGQYPLGHSTRISTRSGARR
jgi:exopolysaccharide production protein ExoQ